VSHYFFHVRNSIEADDEEGRELADDAAAKAHAVDSARSLASHDVRNGTLDLSHRIEIADQDGKRVATVTFGDAVVIKR